MNLSQTLINSDWVTEPCPGIGSAFSLKIKRKVHDEQTAFARIEIYETLDFGYLMVIEGSMMLTTRENFLYHEMMSHPVLFTHPHPQDVVIIGGGDCGTLREVLKHPSVTSVTQIEIDERVTRLAEIYFPELCTGNHDPRAHFAFTDGIAWIAQAPADSIDILIIDCTDPVGPAEGLFTESFYRDCHAALRKDGIFIQQGESPLYHGELIRQVHQAMHRAGFAHTEIVHFPQPCYPSGWWCGNVASNTQQLTHFRQHDVDNKAFATRYYNSAIHQAALAQPNFVRELL